MTDDRESTEDMLDVAESLISEQRYEEAIAASRRALENRTAISGERAEELIRPLTILGRSIAERIVELSKESSVLARRAVDLAREHFGEADIRTARVLFNMSLSLRGGSTIDEAITFLFQALDVAERVHDAEQSLWILRVLTNTLLQAARYTEALELCARLQSREEEREGAPNLRMIASYQLGLCLLRLGQKERAATYLEHALELRTKHRPDGDRSELEDLLSEARSDGVR